MHRSYRQIAHAFLEADDSPDFITTLSDECLEVEEPRALIEAVTAIVSTLAFRAEESPRTVFEAFFSQAPSDELWEKISEAWREQRGE